MQRGKECAKEKHCSLSCFPLEFVCFSLGCFWGSGGEGEGWVWAGKDDRWHLWPLGSSEWAGFLTQMALGTLGQCAGGGGDIGVSPWREGDFTFLPNQDLPISDGLKEGLGLEMGVVLCPCDFIFWWFGSKMFTRNTHTQLEKSTDFLWVSQAQSCCCGFSLQSCQSRSDFPNYPTLPMARTCSMSCLLLLWRMQRPRAP